MQTIASGRAVGGYGAGVADTESETPGQVDREKARWRTRLSAARREREPAERAAARASNAAALLAELRGARTVCAYLPLGTEPLDPAVIGALVVAGVRVLLPVATADRPLEWAVAGGGVRRGAFGIDEPTGKLLGPDAVRDADAVCVPALAVDGSGVRLGRGGGHYDRTLSRLGRVPGVRLIAVVYDEEVVDSLPADFHDVRVNALVTPSRGVMDLPLPAGALHHSPRSAHD